MSVIIIILLFSIQLNFPPKRNQHLELNMKHQNQLEFDSQRNDFVKLREREGQGVDPGRSLKGHLWMVDGGWWYTFP